MQNSKSFNVVGEAAHFENDFLTRVLEHSHLAIDVDLIEKDEVTTPFGQLKKSSFENDVKFLKPKSHKSDKDFLDQIAYLQSLIELVRNLVYLSHVVSII